MDAGQFDSWTKIFGKATSRRGVLLTGVAGGLAGLGRDVAATSRHQRPVGGAAVKNAARGCAPWPSRGTERGGGTACGWRRGSGGVRVPQFLPRGLQRRQAAAGRLSAGGGGRRGGRAVPAVRGRPGPVSRRGLCRLRRARAPRAGYVRLRPRLRPMWRGVRVARLQRQLRRRLRDLRAGRVLRRRRHARSLRPVRAADDLPEPGLRGDRGRLWRDPRLWGLSGRRGLPQQNVRVSPSSLSRRRQRRLSTRRNLQRWGKRPQVLLLPQREHASHLHAGAERDLLQRPLRLRRRLRGTAGGVVARVGRGAGSAGRGPRWTRRVRPRSVGDQWVRPAPRSASPS